MSADERYKNIKKFDTDDEPSVLARIPKIRPCFRANLNNIVTYAVNVSGHDAQHRCAYVAHVESGFNCAAKHQAYSRSYRIGQTRSVEVVGLFVENTYQETHECYMLKKAGDTFAAYQDFNKETTESSSLGDLSRSLCGMWRRRVRDQMNARTSKNTATIRSRRREVFLSS